MSLPTPAPSSEIHAKPSYLASAGLDSFSLPPAAISPPVTRNNSVADASSTPISPIDLHHSGKSKSSNGKRKSSVLDQHQEYAIPPPPTRSRKIIQMKPRSGSDSSTSSSRNSQPILTPALSPSATTPKISSSSSTALVPATSNKRKATTSTPTNTAANRKMARKTAHSLIERRRRSKMNEEFGVLKDMIPACTGQEMHKLAILQASIEYMRYLEKCLADLKDAHSHCGREAREESSRSSSPATNDRNLELPPIRSFVESMPPRMSSISPALPRGSTASSYNGPVQGWTGSRSSRLPSPVLKLPSPHISPRQMPEDHEVTTALLMLNSSRGSFNQSQRERNISIGKRPFTVRELLTEE
jgi:hypothetical protein